MQVMPSRGIFSRLRNNLKKKVNVYMPSPRSATDGAPARAEEKERRDLVEHRFMEMDEEHTRIRDRFLSSLPHRFE